MPTKPPAKLDRATVLHVARLAALSLSDDEADRFTEELARIVAYVGELQAVDTTGVEPTGHGGGGGDPADVRLTRDAWRADEVAPCLSHEDALAAAPRVEGDGFAVPVFVE